MPVVDGGRALRALRVGLVATVFCAVALGTHAAPPPRSAAEDIRGLWVDHRDAGKHKVGVLIEDCDGQLCGRIYWLRKPLSGGAPKRDHHNLDAALRERPLCGLRILTGFQRAKEASWDSGYVYNPNDGRTFHSTINLQDDGSLRIRGYVGLPIFGKTVEWVRPQERLDRCS